MSNTTHVNAFSPTVTGGLYIAPAGTPLPASIDEELGAGFVRLGYVSEDGITDSYSPDTTKVPAWGGDQVATLSAGVEHTLSFSLLECTKLSVAKYVYGDDNVTGTDGNLTIKVNQNRFKEHVLVVDMFAKNSGTSQRNVYPRGVISELGDTVYVHSDVTALEVTVDFLADSDGQTEYIYTRSGSGSDPVIP